MDLSLFTYQIVNVRLKNQNFYEGVKLTYTRNADYVLGPALDGSYYGAYSSKGTVLDTPNTGLDIEDIQLANLNLNDYVGFDVEITSRNWNKHQCVLLKYPSLTYPFVSNNINTAWSKEGKWCVGISDNDIIHIKFSKPQPPIKFSKPQSPIMNRPELLSTIAETKRQLNKLEEQLAQNPPSLQDAVVGDVLADGSEVVYKYSGRGLTLLAAPSEFNCQIADQPNFENYLNNLGTKLNRWGWFIPTAELLELAFGRLELKNLNRVPHWTCSKERWRPFYSQHTGARIRAFRYVSY